MNLASKEVKRRDTSRPGVSPDDNSRHSTSTDPLHNPPHHGTCLRGRSRCAPPRLLRQAHTRSLPRCCRPDMMPGDDPWKKKKPLPLQPSNPSEEPDNKLIMLSFSRKTGLESKQANPRKEQARTRLARPATPLRVLLMPARRQAAAYSP